MARCHVTKQLIARAHTDHGTFVVAGTRRTATARAHAFGPRRLGQRKLFAATDARRPPCQVVFTLAEGPVCNAFTQAVSVRSIGLGNASYSRAFSPRETPRLFISRSVERPAPCHASTGMGCLMWCPTTDRMTGNDRAIQGRTYAARMMSSVTVVVGIVVVEVVVAEKDPRMVIEIAVSPAPAHRNVDRRIVVADRAPAYVVGSVIPPDVGGSEHPTGNPEPAEPDAEIPAPIAINGPGPGLRSVPHWAVGTIGPATAVVGTPIIGHAWVPDPAELVVIDPFPIAGEFAVVGLDFVRQRVVLGSGCRVQGEGLRARVDPHAERIAHVQDNVIGPQGSLACVNPRALTSTQDDRSPLSCDLDSTAFDRDTSHLVGLDVDPHGGAAEGIDRRRGGVDSEGIPVMGIRNLGLKASPTQSQNRAIARL